MSYRYTIAVCVVLASISSCINSVRADVRLGTGVNCGIPVGDGIWIQERSGSSMDKCDNAFSLQYVGQINSWLDYMAGFSYRKGLSVSSGSWVTDDCYLSRQFSGGRVINWHGKPEFECDMRYHSKSIETVSKGLTLALVPTYRGQNWSVFTSIGISIFYATTKIEWDDTQGVCSYRDGGCGVNYHNLKDRSSYLDFGFTYKQIFMTLYYAPNERGGEAPNSGNYGLILGYGF